MSGLQIQRPQRSLIGLRIVASLGIIVAGAGLTGCSSPASGPDKAQVIIYDDGIVPAEAHIPAGETITWTNRGQRRHGVASDTGAFESFEVASGEQHGASFGQVGRFPYAVDHDLHGVIVVEAGQAGEAGQAAGTPNPTDVAPGTHIVHYAVKVTATSSHMDSTEGFSTSLNDTHVEWTGIWKDVPITIDKDDDAIRLSTTGAGDVADPDGAPGDVTVSVDYHHITPASMAFDPVLRQEVVKEPAVDCADKITQKVYHGGLGVGGMARPGDVGFHIEAHTEGAAGPSDMAFQTEYQHRCEGASPNWPGLRDFPIDSRLTFEVVPMTIALRVDRDQSPAMFPPFDLILAHRAFELTTGPRNEAHDAPRRSDRSQWQATIQFTPN